MDNNNGMQLKIAFQIAYFWFRVSHFCIPQRCLTYWTAGSIETPFQNRNCISPVKPRLLHISCWVSRASGIRRDRRWKRRQIERSPLHGWVDSGAFALNKLPWCAFLNKTTRKLIFSCMLKSSTQRSIMHHLNRHWMFSKRYHIAIWTVPYVHLNCFHKLPNSFPSTDCPFSR